MIEVVEVCCCGTRDTHDKDKRVLLLKQRAQKPHRTVLDPR